MMQVQSLVYDVYGRHIASPDLENEYPDIMPVNFAAFSQSRSMQQKM